MTMFNYKYNKIVAVLSNASTFRDANLHHWCTASEGWLPCSKQEVSGSHWAGPSLDFHFKTRLEATSTLITIKSSWRRMCNNKRLLFVATKLLFLSMRDGRSALCAGDHGFKFRPAGKTCCRNSEHHTSRSMTCYAESFCTLIINHSRIWLLPKTLWFLYHLLQPSQRQSWKSERFWLVYNSSYSVSSSWICRHCEWWGKVNWRIWKECSALF